MPMPHEPFTRYLHRYGQHVDAAPTVAAARQELAVTVPLLLAMAQAVAPSAAPPAMAIAIANTRPIRCQRYWNPLAKTFTYHTHVAVPAVAASTLDHVSTLFFNAYALQQHGWYSQFVRGAMYATEDTPRHATEGEHQLGQGYFDFGVPGLRCYHTLFSRLAPDANTRLVVLRTVDEPMPALQPAKTVYLLPPTGDVFTLEGNTLHWHHICTTTGIGLLPGALDRLFMNLLRYCGFDRQEQQTYLAEAEGFVQFVQGLSPAATPERC